MTVTTVSQSSYPVPAPSREAHVAKMRAAADKHLPDYSPEERQTWAEKTVDAYLRRGILVIAEEVQ